MWVPAKASTVWTEMHVFQPTFETTATECERSSTKVKGRSDKPFARAARERWAVRKHTMDECEAQRRPRQHAIVARNMMLGHRMGKSCMKAEPENT